MRTFSLGSIGVAMALAACQEPAAPWLTMPTPEQHAARYFPTTSDTVHGPFTCDDCHTDPATFRSFECLGCHAGAHTDEATVAALHGAVPDFQFTSAACYACHRDGIGVDHARIFPIDAGAHASTTCGQCHLDPADRTLLGCAGCHPHTAEQGLSEHLAVAGYAFDSARCVRCHADSQVDRVAEHLPFQVTDGPHSAAKKDCLRCHPAVRSDKPFGADFGSFDCLDCHDQAKADEKHAGMLEYRYASAACYECHPTGRKD